MHLPLYIYVSAFVFYIEELFVDDGMDYVICLCQSFLILLMLSGWLVRLWWVRSAKVEGVKLETSFMSERASQLLSSVGLLGEYCPSSRKKEAHSGPQVGCMLLGPREGYTIRCRQGCQCMRPVPFVRDFYHAEEILAVEHYLLAF